MSDSARLAKARDQVVALVKGASDLTDEDKAAIGELLTRAGGATSADVIGVTKCAEELGRRLAEQGKVIAQVLGKVADYKPAVIGYIDELAEVAPAALGKAAQLTPQQRASVLDGHHTAVALLGEICHHTAQCLKEAKAAPVGPNAWGIEGTSTDMGSGSEPPGRDSDEDMWKSAVARHATPAFARN